MRLDILGVGFDPITLPDAVTAGMALAGSEGFHYVVTPNPEFILLADRDEHFRSILYHADLVLADGVGVIHAANILGTPLPGRVTGIDFAAGLMQEMARTGEKKLFLLGAKPGVAAEAGRRLQKTYPGLNVCGTRDGYFKDAESEAVAAQIAQSGADVLFVCLGAPKQEKWLAQYGKACGVHLAAGLGGVLDVFAGNVDRAPAAFQKAGMEWFYRLVKQPSRIGRMAKLPGFLGKAAAARVKRGKS